MAKKNFYIAAKRSEYRNNYLPFDYYDFWITAKENENLRFRNKIRDYVHTPFDWDEDQELYLEPVKFDVINQATQTSERPKSVPANRVAQQKRNSNHNKENLVGNSSQNQDVIYHQDHHHHHHHPHHQHQHQHQQQHQNYTSNSNSDREHPCNHSDHKRLDKKQQKKGNKKLLKQSNKKNIVPVNQVPNNIINGQQPKSIISKRARSSSARRSSRNSFSDQNNINNNNERRYRSKSQNRDNLVSRSFSSASIQTPPEWNIRDYKSKKQTQNLTRSSSMVNLQAKRPPFANYGAGSRTKDLSVKPTYNALANKILAEKNDHDAIIELTLQRLKKDAAILANEYSAIESKVVDRYRSDSKCWNTEYDEQYPDYSKSGLKKELYYAENPYRLSKSMFVNNYPPLHRGPRSIKEKIFYYD